MIHSRTAPSTTPDTAHEHFRMLTAYLNVGRSTNRGSKTIGVTSCVLDEGVSTTALSLATSLTDSRSFTKQSVVLVDVSQPLVGSANSAAEETTILESVEPTGTDGLFRLDADRRTCDSQLRQSDMSSSGWDQLRQHYEWIVVDLPPVAHTDRLVEYLPFMDDLVLVIEAGRMSGTILRQGIQFLSEARGRSPWVVLNKCRETTPRWLRGRTKTPFAEVENAIDPPAAPNSPASGNTRQWQAR